MPRAANWSRAAKAKGRNAEAAVVDYLRLRGIPAERRRLTGAQDCGDVGGWQGWCVEVKAEKRVNLAGYLDELAAELGNARVSHDAERGVAVVKRRGHTNAADWYAVMPFAHLVDLAQELAAALARITELEARMST